MQAVGCVRESVEVAMWLIAVMVFIGEMELGNEKGEGAKEASFIIIIRPFNSTAHLVQPDRNRPLQ